MVYAKIIYLLMVVISGALCTVEDYVIMSQCAHNKAINLAAEGTVSVTDISQTQNITIVGRPDFVNNNFKIALYAKETQRYLCFNDHWKLVGMKELQDTCYFNEAIVHGYFVFRSVVDLQRRIGFTQRGRAVGPKKTVNDACYMFTKIPTDQFFHQHTHFSAPKMKSTTTRLPKTQYTHATHSTLLGRGSGGGGRIKTNRFKAQHRQEDTVAYSQSDSGSGSGGGSGSGSGSGFGNVNGSGKKFRKHRKGNKQRQRKQETQQQQQHIRGHSYNLNNPKNSTYLNSSRQNLVLSQHSINNYHTNRKHNNNSIINSNSNSNHKNHPPQNHQVRHHHNDPNKIARRHHHDQKQKTKMRQRIRSSPSPSPSSAAVMRPTATTTTIAAAAATTIATTTSLTTAKIMNANKPHHKHTSSVTEINPTKVVHSLATDATSEIHNAMTSTVVVVTKRKGRRRKSDKSHKKGLRKQLLHASRDNSFNSTVGLAYEKLLEMEELEEEEEEEAEEDEEEREEEKEEEEGEEYRASLDDYVWMTNDIMLSSVKPTSASLPSWATWYPSSSAAYAAEDSEDSDYLSAPLATPATEQKSDRRYSVVAATLDSSSMTDFDKNTLSSQASIPLPTTTFFSSNLTENGIDETISPTVTTDLGMTTTNTSTYTQTDFWSNRRNAHTDVTNGFARKETFNTYTTPMLGNTADTFKSETETFLEDTNSSSSVSYDSLPVITIENVSSDDNKPDSSSSADRAADGTRIMTIISNGKDINQSRDDAVTTATTATLTNNSTAHTGKSMTDFRILAKKTAPIVANNHNHHKHKHGETSPTQHTTQKHQLSKMGVAIKGKTNSSVNTISTRHEKNASWPEATSTIPYSPTTSLAQAFKNLAAVTSLQYLNPTSVTGEQIDDSHTADDLTTSTAHSSAVLSTKSTATAPAPSPLTTRKTLRKSTQRLLATPFHQLTYVRNNDGDIDIDIDNIDNISIYPDLLDNDSDSELPLVKPSTSRLTMISGYLPTSATVTLPESIRIAKIKINRERKRMLRLRNFGNRT